jgi:WD domain, G-beta repeat
MLLILIHHECTMTTSKLHKASPDAAKTTWGRLTQKQRNSVVGTTFFKIIEKLDSNGNASLLESLDALFGGDEIAASHKALKTQFINRPFVDDSGKVLLKLCASRVSSKNPIDQAQLWFELPQALDATSPNLRTVPNADVLNIFTEGSGIDFAGKDSVQMAKSEALRAAEATQAVKRYSKNSLNYGITGARHGSDKGAFQDGTRGHEEALSAHESKGRLRAQNSPDKVTHTQAQSVLVLPTLLQWAQNTSPTAPRLYAMLGDAGTGKTSHGQQFARILNGEVAHADWPIDTLGQDAPNAIFIDLAELSGVGNLAQLSLEEMLVLVLKRLDGVAVQTVADVAPLVADARAGHLIFIFDGLDELLKNDPLVLQKVFEQFLKVVERRSGHSGSADGVRPPKAIVSCRSHYFRDVEAQHSFFTARGRGSVSKNDYRCITLLPWGNDLIESYLTRRVGTAEAQRLLALIANTYNLAELASKPVLLSMMAENLQALLAEQGAGLPILASTLYSKTVSSWIERDSGKHELNPAHKPLLMGALAAAMWNDKSETWPADRLDQWLVRAVQDLFPDHYAPSDRQGLQNDLRTATFIVRPHDSQFNFAHKSYGEYFLARFMLDGLTQVADGFWSLPLLSQYLPMHMLNAEAMAFLTEMWQADNQFSKRSQSRRASVLCELLQTDGDNPDAARAPALHAVLWQMLRATKLPITAASDAAFNLRGLDFSDQRWEDLDTKQISALDLRGANLRGMYVLRCQFGRVICNEHTNAEQAVFRGCDTSKFDWGGAQRSGLIVRGQSGPRPSGGVALAGPWSLPRGQDAMLCVAFNARGTLLAIGGNGGSVRLWDVVNKSEAAVLKGSNSWIVSVAFNSTGTLLASGGSDGIVQLWDVSNLVELVVLKGHKGAVASVAFNSTGTLLASGGIDGIVQLWDVSNLAPLVVLKGHRSEVESVAFNATGTLLASSGDDGRVRLWDMTSKSKAPALKGKSGGVMSVAFNPTGKFLASSGNDGTVRLWDVTSRSVAFVLKGHSGRVMCVAFHPTGTLLASSGMDGTVRLWDLASKSIAAVLKGHGGGAVFCVAFNPAGTQLASGGHDGTVRLWDMTEPSNPKPAYQVIVPAPKPPFSPSWASFDGEGNLLDWSDSAIDHWLHSLRDGRPAPIESVL